MRAESGKCSQTATYVGRCRIYLVAAGPQQGTSVIRKISETLPGGRVIYSDTNNSAEDFLGDVPAAPVLKPLWK